jgi:hypothetical protein
MGLGVAIPSFALSRRLPFSCVLIFISGAFIMASASLMLSLVQLIVSDQMRGRVMSVYSLAFRAGIPQGRLYSPFKKGTHHEDGSSQLFCTFKPGSILTYVLS